MGCSPSKGQLFAQKDKALKFESNSDLLSNTTELQSLPEKPIVSNGVTLLEKEEEDCTPVPLQGKISSPCIAPCDTATVVKGNADLIETDVYPQESDKRDKTSKNTSSPISRKRSDPPETVEKVHQAAFAYLEPNVPKCESILELLDKARHTQFSLQPSVTLLVLQYEEINQTLEELAADGEKMLEDHGVSMTWAAEQMYSNIPEAEPDSTDTPPDLLQHMLHHSINKIRLVIDSVTGHGDTALEEAVSFFSTLSHQLGEKLLVKRAADSRLKQVLTCIEAAAMKKSSLKDATLHSEDSGIGADNEGQNGSGRLCGHRTSSGSGVSTGSSDGCSQNSSPDQLYVNEAEKKRDEDDNNDEDIHIDSEVTNKEEEQTQDEWENQTDLRTGTMLGWSHEDANQSELQVSLRSNGPTGCTLKPTDKRNKRNIRRPQSADNASVPCKRKPRHPWRSLSADCLISNLDIMVQGHCKSQNPEKQWSVLECKEKETFKSCLSSSFQPLYTPEPPGRNAVKRLINTFSQGLPNTPNPKPFHRPTSRFKGSKQCFLPILTKCRAGLSTNANDVNKRLSVRPEDEDVESLPPPPPEILTDSSFGSNDSTPGNEVSNQRQKSDVLHLRSKLQSVSLLPSRASISRCPNPSRQDHVVEGQFEENTDPQYGGDAEKEEALRPYQQKFNQGYSSNLPGDHRIDGSSSVKVLVAVRQKYTDSDECKTAIPYTNCHPPTTPLISTTQIPPSINSVCHKLPSLPFIPSSEKHPDNGHWEASQSTSNVQRWTKRSIDAESGFTSSPGSLSFYDTGTIFSQETQSNSKLLRPSCRSTLPRPWGEASRGRLQTTCLSQTFTRGIPSNDSPTFTDQHPALSTDAEPHHQGNKDRKDSAAEISEQETQTNGLAFGEQQAKSEGIMDNQD